jgi:hypothetical protein
MRATIYESGNGYPDVDDYVATSDGGVYRVVSIPGHIQTGEPGEDNRIEDCDLEIADWRDVGASDEPVHRAVLD